MDVSSATMAPRADERELGIFDSKNELILEVWMKGGQIERMELFRHMDRYYWTNFAKFGNPNGPGVPVWQEFDPVAGNFQSLIPPSPVQETDFAASHHCAFWAALLSAQ